MAFSIMKRMFMNKWCTNKSNHKHLCNVISILLTTHFSMVGVLYFLIHILLIAANILTLIDSLQDNHYSIRLGQMRLIKPVFITINGYGYTSITIVATFLLLLVMTFLYLTITRLHWLLILLCYKKVSNPCN